MTSSGKKNSCPTILVFVGRDAVPGFGESALRTDLFGLFGAADRLPQFSSTPFSEVQRKVRRHHLILSMVKVVDAENIILFTSILSAPANSTQGQFTLIEQEVFSQQLHLSPSSFS
jgi:hypothetical protein